MNYQNYLNATNTLLKINSMENDHFVNVCGRKFFVGKNVFSPKYFYDTEIFAKHLAITRGNELLEIGPGCGAIGITKCHEGASRYVAIDINPAAVYTTQINARSHGFKSIASIRQGNVFSALDPNERFDIAFWNVPFGLINNKQLSPLEYAVFDPGYKSIQKFIINGFRILRPGGRLIIGFSSTLGKLNLLHKFTNQTGRKLELVYQENSNETR